MPEKSTTGRASITAMQKIPISREMDMAIRYSTLLFIFFSFHLSIFSQKKYQ
jgi:hypothetical protein